LKRFFISIAFSIFDEYIFLVVRNRKQNNLCIKKKIIFKRIEIILKCSKQFHLEKSYYKQNVFLETE